MDFDDTPSQAAYRRQVRDWLRENAPRRARALTIGDGRPTNLGGEDAAQLAAAKTWQKRKAEAGFAQVAWPREWGGGGGTPIEAAIFLQEEEAALGTELWGPFGIGLGMCLPTVMHYADPAQARRFAHAAVCGEEIWCQLFSEPDAGSDLANLHTRADRDGEGGGGWIVNGQKIWTSGAHYCDYGLLLARSDFSAPKHRGLTMFWIDMKAPEVECRPIRQLSGGSGFNEVFFTDLRIADSQRLGAVGEGWSVALYTLMNERAAVGGGRGVPGGGVREIMDLLRDGLKQDGEADLPDSLLERLADWYVRLEGLRLTGLRGWTALSRGEAPGPEHSVTKLVLASLLQEMGSELVDLQGSHGLIEDSHHGLAGGLFQQLLKSATGRRIAGGTDEILRNIIAERVLGLPLEPRADKGRPFSAAQA